jgi:cysteinyl-tRNA synthetase
MVAAGVSDHDVDASERHGGSYQLPPDAGPIASTCQYTEDEIHFLIAKRSECKTARNFEDADRILEGLKKEGVYLHDKRKEWRADGNNQFGNKTNEDRDRKYVQRGGSHGLSQDTLDEIAAVVERRAKAKRIKDFRSYNELSETLLTTYGVHVNDKKREWSMSFVASAEEQEVISVYVPSPIAPLDDPTHTMDEESKAMIQKRLTDRLTARRNKDYALADFIKVKLQEEYSVVIDDRTREWRIATNDKEDVSVQEKKDKSIDLLKEDSQTVMGDATLEISADSLIDGDDAAEKAAPVAAKDQETESHLMTLTMVVLKEKLRDAGLPVSGKKAELVERLLYTSN